MKKRAIEQTKQRRSRRPSQIPNRSRSKQQQQRASHIIRPTVLVAQAQLHVRSFNNETNNRASHRKCEPASNGKNAHEQPRNASKPSSTSQRTHPLPPPFERLPNEIHRIPTAFLLRELKILGRQTKIAQQTVTEAFEFVKHLVFFLLGCLICLRL